MSNIDLTKYGITDVKEILHNPSYEVLFEEETNPALEGYEKGQLTELDTINVMTGIYTGRSPKDKFFVMNEASKDTVWWTSEEYKNDNKPCSEEAWADLRAKAINMASMMNVPVVGLIENMSYFTCPNCSEKHHIFGKGSTDEVSERFGIPVLAKLPIDMRTPSLEDKGAIELADTDPLMPVIDTLLGE